MSRAKASAKIKRPLPPPHPHFEVTKERLNHAANDTVLIKAVIEKAGERPLLTRKFFDSTVDRWRKAGRLTEHQWHAAEWYREQFEAAGMTARVVANYNADANGTGGSTYGLPTTERQARARQAWRRARTFIPGNMLGLVDNLVLYDLAPAMTGGRQRERYAERIGRALGPLADWLRGESS